jgi:molecular chaperone Hsp33
MPQRDGDTLNRFIFEDTNVRGEVVHLDATWQAVLERHRYPPVVRDLLGEALAAAALLVTTIKSSSSLTLQIQGDGPVNMIVVQADANQTLRGLARWKGPVVAGPLRQQVGSARLAITLDPGEGRERYQGIVGLEAEESLAEALETYFQRSEQLELPHRELLRRLFHEEDVRVFNARPISFRCSCSRERIELMLRGLGYDEVRQIVDEEGDVAVTCEFCNQRYAFDPVDVEQLFAACDQPRVPPTRH